MLASKSSNINDDVVVSLYASQRTQAISSGKMEIYSFFTICRSCPSYMLYACHALVNAILDRVFAHVNFGQAKTKIATCLGVISRAKTLPEIMHAEY
jgi:hypothetical protein